MIRYSKPLLKPLGLVAGLLLAPVTHGEAFKAPGLDKDYNYNYKEFNNIKTDVTTLTTGVFGDTVDLGSGSLGFSQTDVSLPGNFDLPVAITRTLSSPDTWYSAPLQVGNWSLDLPHARSTYVTQKGDFKTAYWPGGEACTRPLNANPGFQVTVPSGGITVSYGMDKAQYWNGDTVSIPGKGSTKLLTNDGSTQRYNNRQWKVECIEQSGKPEGFKITTGDGIKYYLTEQRVVTDYQKVMMSPPPNSGCLNTPDMPCDPEAFKDSEYQAKLALEKHYIFLLVSRVEDKFNNYVTYHYSGDNGQLDRISASDGREITLAYNTGGNLDSVTANGRTWQYRYDAATHGIAPLNQVILPDGRGWQFNNANEFNNTTYWREFFPPQPLFGDDCLAGSQDSTFIEMAHPDGLKGRFEISGRCHGQTGVPQIVRFNASATQDQESHWLKTETRLLSLSKKVLTLSDGRAYTWQYDNSI